MKTSGKIAACALGVAAAANAVHAAAFRPKKETVAPLSAENVNVERYRAHLSRAIQIKTISNREPDRVDWNEFQKFQDFIDEAFPLIREKLEKTVVPPSNLVFHWKGTRSDLDPIAMLAHQDVVPISEGTEGDWTYPDGRENHEQPAELHQVYFNDPIIGTSTAQLEDQFGINVGLGNRARSTFNDATFDGGSYRMEIPMVTNTLFKANDSINAFVEIKLRHLTEGAYNYYTTITSGNSLSQYYREPVGVYSTVQNGFGLVAGSNDKTLSFPVW